MKHTQLKIM